MWMCLAEPSWDIAGDLPVFCTRYEYHNGQHYNDELGVHWW